ncbi:MAG: hypothetical protein OXM55_04655 [Bdellovibrionales bacterium]|nr:hypothetical protein [Bdellovibrionales bacterium]
MDWYHPLKRNKGLSIIEALVVAFIAGVVLVGTGKMISVSLHSSKTIQASTAEQSLIWSIGKVLTETISCKANLTPSSGGISAINGKGTINALIQGLGNPHVEDIPLVKIGSFKDVLEVVKMDFTGSGTGNPKTSTVIRDFVVYYKKQGMGTLEDKPCDSSNQEGCHFQRCSLKYKLENNPSPSVEVCDVQNCAGLGENHIAGISCGAGKYLKGFDSNGNKICEAVISSVTSYSESCIPHINCNKVRTLGSHLFCALSGKEGPGGGGYYMSCKVTGTVNGTWELIVAGRTSTISHGCSALCFD